MLGGQCTGGAPKRTTGNGDKGGIKDYGYMHMDAWDLLWSITAKAMLAAELLRPMQVSGNWHHDKGQCRVHTANRRTFASTADQVEQALVPLQQTSMLRASSKDLFHVSFWLFG